MTKIFMGNTQYNDNSSPQGDQNGEEGGQETEEEIREQVIDEYGFDPDKHEKMIEAAVKREKKHKKELGTVIRQKQNWRGKAKSQGKDQSGQGKSRDTNQGDSGDIDTLLEKKLEERELKKMDLPDEVEKEVRDLAQVKGISMSEAVEHDYIQSLKEKVEHEQKVEGGTPPRSSKGNKGKSSRKKDFSKPLNPKDYDFDNPDDRERWENDKKKRDQYRKNK